MVAWVAAQHQPPSLKAIVPWEAGNDLLFSLFRPGGIANTNFLTHWWNNCVVLYQHGRAEGVSEAELEQNRVDFMKNTAWEFRTQGHYPILAKFRGLDKIEVPLYSAANWIDSEVHAPGNILGYMWSSSKNRYLETHSGDHVNAFYGRDAITRQRRFLDHFLKNDHVAGEPSDIPKVDLTIRKGAKNYRRAEKEFPPADTQYKELFMNADGQLNHQAMAGTEQDVVVRYEGLHGNTFFTSDALEHNFEVLGFPYLELDVATSAKDMDIFVTITNVARNGELVVFEGNHAEPSVSVARGYLRISHRALDSKRATDRLIILAQEKPSVVTPGERYRIKVPIQPTSMVFETGHKIRLEVGATDSETLLGVMKHEGGDRTPERFAGDNMIFLGSKLVLPYVVRE